MRRCLWLHLLLIAAAAPQVHADEGMWPMNLLPTEYLKETYGFAPDDAWVENVQKACVRFGSGGSASFVSPTGLVMTNHHVGSRSIAALSDAQHDYMKDGFYAQRREDELKCSRLTLEQLMAIEDVTAKVNAGIDQGTGVARAQELRQQAIAKIQAEAKKNTGLQPEVVKLYHGARYHLYLYKVYEDVRLVMAPEQGIAFFGGDIDNFEYPRYNLDVSFFRAYENGKPARTEHHLSWSAAGPQENELLFMAGNPARTRRMYTVDHLKFLRDVELPLILEVYNQREVALTQFRAQGAEFARIGKGDLFGTQNGRKAFGGILAGLLDSRIMQQKIDKEDALRTFARSAGARHPAPYYLDAWRDLGAALQELRTYYPAYFLLENRRSSLGQLNKIARTLVRAAEERQKPDGQRLPGYREAELQEIESVVLADKPIYEELELLHLTDGLTRFARILGGDHALVKRALIGETPESRAAQILNGSKLKDLSYRKSLWEGGLSAIQGSNDSMIRFALSLEPYARQLIDRHDKEFTAVENKAYARIAEATFERYGEDIYPDATYHLRLSIGTVLGIADLNIPAMTTIGGTFSHAAAHDYRAPFDLPKSWKDHKGKLDLSVPFNFISTNDIIGGNSGSPAFNRQGQVVGIVFDGNIHSLVWDIQFDQQRARAVSVHSQAITEALGKIYNAPQLVDELLGQ